MGGSLEISVACEACMRSASRPMVSANVCRAASRNREKHWSVVRPVKAVDLIQAEPVLVSLGGVDLRRRTGR